MKMNRGLVFIQPSGGNVDHVHHIKLLPLGDGFQSQGSSPGLPSGSVWLRPNDGQTERLEYQGEDSLFQTRPAEGYACYITTSLSTVRQAIDGINANEIERTVLEDYGFYSLLDLDHVKIHVSGLYRITASTRYDNTAVSVEEMSFQIRKNDTDDLVDMSSVVAHSSDGGGVHVCVNIIVKLNRGDEISFLATEVGAAVLTLAEGMYTFEFIRPLDLGAGANII